MARIALLGYGRMGKQIEHLATARGHEIVMRCDSLFQPHPDRKIDADVAIDFSRPEAAEALCRWSLDQGIATLSGTTGWSSKALQQELQAKPKTAFLHSSNTSIGVNILFMLNRVLAKVLNQKPYEASLTEIHHVHKLDAPSGTALTLAEDLIAAQDQYQAWQLVALDEVAESGHLPIASQRKGEVIGTHELRYRSGQDQLILRHEAFNRDGFALGAILAAEFLVGKKGVFAMSDVLAL